MDVNSWISPGTGEVHVRGGGWLRTPGLRLRQLLMVGGFCFSLSVVVVVTAGGDGGGEFNGGSGTGEACVARGDAGCICWIKGRSRVVSERGRGEDERPDEGKGSERRGGERVVQSGAERSAVVLSGPAGDPNSPLASSPPFTAVPYGTVGEVGQAFPFS